MSVASTVRKAALWPYDPTGRAPRPVRLPAPPTGRPGAVDRDEAPAEPPGTLTAGAQIIPLGIRDKLKDLTEPPPRRRGWQVEAWDYYDALGDIKYAINYTANALSKMRLYVGWIDDPGKPPVPIEDAVPDPDDTLEPGKLYPSQELADLARVEFARLKHAQGGQAELSRLAGLNLGVAGEGFLIGEPPQPGMPADVNGQGGKPPRPETWDLYSIEEVDFFEDKDGVHVRILDLDDPASPAAGSVAGNAEGRQIADDALVLRIYRRHGRRRRLADSAMRGILSDCEELLLLNRMIRGSARSRLAGAGILLVPTELQITTNSGPGGTPGAGGQVQADPFGDLLMEAMVTPLSDEANAASVVPLLLRGKGEFIDKVKHLVIDRPMDATAANLREEKRAVIAVGLDIPPELLTGKGDLNHWTAWQVDEDTFQGHIEPTAQLIVSAYTVGFLRPALTGIDPALLDRVVVWYDASNVVSRPNRFLEMTALHEKGLISDDYYRGQVGVPDGAAPEVGELMFRLAWQKGTIDAPIVEALLRYVAPDLEVRRAVRAGEEIVDDQEGVPPPDDGGEQADPTDTPPATGESGPPPVVPAEPAGPGDAPATQPGTSIAAAGRRRAHTAGTRRRNGAVLGRRLHQVDRRASAKLAAAAEAAMRRALERAGNRLNTRVASGSEVRRAIAAVPRWQACATVGAPLIASLGLTEDQLLTDDFDDLADLADLYLSEAQTAALDLAATYAGVPTASTTYANSRTRQDVHRAAAIAALVAGMSALARRRLFDPAPDAPPLGEADLSSSVPAGLIRRVLAIAGGAGSATDSGGLSNTGATVYDGAGLERPAGGIGTGDLVDGLLSDAGIGVESMTWVYGVSARPFEPHLALDGQDFADWTDPVLFNGDSFPPVEYLAPGDHDGCNCDFQYAYSDGSASGDTILPTRVGETDEGLPVRVSTGEPSKESADVGSRIGADQVLVDS